LGIPLISTFRFAARSALSAVFNRYLFDETQARRYFANLKKEVGFYIDRGFGFPIFIRRRTPTVLMDELLDFIDFLRRTLRSGKYRWKPRSAKLIRK